MWVSVVFALACGGEVETDEKIEVDVVNMPITEWDDRNDPSAQWVYGPLTYGDETQSRRWILHPPPEFANELVGKSKYATCLSQLSEGARMCSIWVEPCMNLLVFSGGDLQLDLYGGNCARGQDLGDWQIVK
jgi:hypothetical protein